MRHLRCRATPCRADARCQRRRSSDVPCVYAPRRRAACRKRVPILLMPDAKRHTDLIASAIRAYDDAACRSPFDLLEIVVVDATHN